MFDDLLYKRKWNNNYLHIENYIRLRNKIIMKKVFEFYM